MVVFSRIVGIDIVVSGYTDGVALRSQGDDIGGGKFAGILSIGIDKRILQYLANLLDMYRFIQRNDIVATSGEVNALAQSANSETNDADNNGNAPCGEALLVHAHEVPVCVLQHVLADGSMEFLVEPFVFLQTVLVDDTSYEHCGEERANQTDDPSGGEASDGTRTRYKEDDTGDERGEVGVEDGRESIAVTGFQSLFDALACSHLFLDALVDEHVGINGGTKR